MSTCYLDRSRPRCFIFNLARCSASVRHKDVSPTAAGPAWGSSACWRRRRGARRTGRSTDRARRSGPHAVSARTDHRTVRTCFWHLASWYLDRSRHAAGISGALRSGQPALNRASEGMARRIRVQTAFQLGRLRASADHERVWTDWPRATHTIAAHRSKKKRANTRSGDVVRRMVNISLAISDVKASVDLTVIPTSNDNDNE
jgi:hypothetical protein